MFTLDRFTYTELQSLPAETVDVIYEINYFLEKGKAMAVKTEKLKSNHATKRT